MTTQQLGIELCAKHLSGSLNYTADILSRISPQYEWQLHPNLFSMLNRYHGGFTTDRFASMTNTQLPVYNSLHLDPYTSGVDALAQQDWAVHNNFVNAPFRLLPKILRIIKEQKAVATVIAHTGRLSSGHSVF
jgi:hypothetical protein